MNYIETVQSAWPDWKIVDEEPLGKGSFGCVYRAERSDITGVTYAAIKIISIPKDKEELTALRREGMSFEETRTYLEKMVRSVGAEIRLMEQVKGFTNIVSIEDYKVIEHPEIPQWQILIRMELLKSLPSVLSEEEIIRLGKDICSALAICRKKNIVHRDIKPENIFINTAGFYKLGDFGVARTMEHMTVGFTRTGTYNYMAPEVFNNSIKTADIDSAVKVDIYSLGMVLYTLCNNGRIPFVSVNGAVDPDERIQAISRRMKGEALSAPKYASAGLAVVIRKACAFDPKERYASAEAFREALESIGMDTGIDTDMDTGTVRMSEETPLRAKKAEEPPQSGNSSDMKTVRMSSKVISESQDMPEPELSKATPNKPRQTSSEQRTNIQRKEAELPVVEPSQREPIIQRIISTRIWIPICVICLIAAIIVFRHTSQTGEITDSWEEIITHIDDGTAKWRYAIGATKELDLGTFGTVHMQLAGFSLDERADGKGKAETTWIAKELLPESQVMNEEQTAAGGWRDSDLRAYLQYNVHSALPLTIRHNLVTVKKRQKADAGMQITGDTLWIPDYAEVFGRDALYYKLLRDKKEKRVKLHDGSAAWWWLRSSYMYNTFRDVNTSGDNTNSTANCSYGVALGFCL